MKRITLFVAIFFIGFACANADVFTNSKAVTVGIEPAYVYMPKSADKGWSNFVLCSGADANFNQTFDEGDSYPSLWTFSNDGTAEQKIQFPFLALNQTSMSIRPYVDEENGLLYLPVGGKINIYNLKDFSIKDSISAGYGTNSVAVSGDRMFISIYPWSGNGTIKEYSISSHALKDSIETAVLPNTVLFYKDMLIVLSEGTYSKEDSKVIFYSTASTPMTKFGEITIGSTGNHMTIAGDYLYVTVNGSAYDKIIDLGKMAVVDSIAFSGLNSYTGPRQTAVYMPNNAADYKDFEFCTAAYSGKAYYGKGNAVTEESEQGDLREAAAISGDGKTIAVTSPLNSSYAGLSTLTLYSRTSSVDENIFTANGKCWPNPAFGNVNINTNKDFTGLCELIVYSENGVKAAEISTNVSDGVISFDTRNLNLSDGVFIAVARFAGTVYTSRFVVEK